MTYSDINEPETPLPNAAFGTARISRVVIAAKHKLVRESIAGYLIAQGIPNVVCAATHEQAMELANQAEPVDLIVVDADMPGFSGLDSLRSVIDAAAGVPVALMSGNVTGPGVLAAIEAGARGVFPKSLGARSIVAGIHFIEAGEVFLPYGLIQDRGRDNTFDIDGQDRALLKLLADGRSNKEIAEHLDVAEASIKLALGRICKRLKARNRTHAAIIARDAGLI